MLPDVDGRRVLCDLQRSEETRSIPVIVCSASAGRMSPQEASLAFAVVEKPFDLMRRLDVVDGAILGKLLRGVPGRSPTVV